MKWSYFNERTAKLPVDARRPNPRNRKAAAAPLRRTPTLRRRYILDTQAGCAQR
jgi:hypothetical protein